MNLKEKVKEVIKKPRLAWVFLANRGFYDYMDDKRYLKLRYKCIMGRDLDLNNPVSFNEKLQWLKVYDRKQVYETMVDKYSAKLFVSEKVGKEYLIPTYGVWDKFEDIKFEKLPNEFVIKCTHDSGGIVIVRDKSSVDFKAIKSKMNKLLKKNFYRYGRECLELLLKNIWRIVHIVKKTLFLRGFWIINSIALMGFQDFFMYLTV